MYIKILKILLIFPIFLSFTSFDFFDLYVYEDFLSKDKNSVINYGLTTQKIENEQTPVFFKHKNSNTLNSIKSECDYNIYNLEKLNLYMSVCDIDEKLSKVKLFDFEKKSIVNPSYLFNSTSKVVLPKFYLVKVIEKDGGEELSEKLIDMEVVYNVENGKYNLIVDFSNSIKPFYINFDIKNESRNIYLDFSDIRIKENNFYIKTNIEKPLTSIMKNYPQINLGEINIMNGRNEYKAYFKYNFERQFEFLMFGKTNAKV